ncbi:RHS repeat-associated core domain-containing protein [Enterobacter asburiae]
MNPSLYSNTPAIIVCDNQGLTVRTLAYHRHPDTPNSTDERITRHRYDARGFLMQSADPRLHDAGLANFAYVATLSGAGLRTQSADAGTGVTLSDAAGRPCLSVSNIRTSENGTEDRSQTVTRSWQYEGAALPGRPLSITEQTPDGVSRITERFVYAGSSDAEKERNLAGQCVSHYDTAGLLQTDCVALIGVPLSTTRRLLKDAGNPYTLADWQGADASAWNDLLATEMYTTLATTDATGAVLTTTDAKGNVQRVTYDVAGLLSGSWLTVRGGTEQIIVRSLTYSAAGQKLREEHGNGVVTTYTYEPQTQRLTGIKTERPAGHASGAKVLQDLRYEYDPVGNVLTVRNDAEATRFWRNQKVAPENAYAYDSLYQLVSTTGREMVNAGQQGSGLPPLTVPLPTDSTAYTNYIRTYTYDAAGNLAQISHSAPATNNNYTTNITVSDRSNRGVLSTLTDNPADVERFFTAGGLQTQLQPGQALTWTLRNELLTVTPVVRDGAANDEESYRYDAGSQRLLKVSRQLTGGSTQTKRTLYLPGLELRTTASGETETENLQVMTVGEAGRAQVRMLHWESGVPEGINNNQPRYSYDNLIGSSQLELDGAGNVISQEEYYPYGGTAVWTACSQVEADYKTVRYSGQERDATGLYYYGWRYYQPWVGRWLSADPAGTVDGLNLFRMVRNNPVTLYDSYGLAPSSWVELGELAKGLGLEEEEREALQRLDKIMNVPPEIESTEDVIYQHIHQGEGVRGITISWTYDSQEMTVLGSEITQKNEKISEQFKKDLNRVIYSLKLPGDEIISLSEISDNGDLLLLEQHAREVLIGTFGEATARQISEFAHQGHQGDPWVHMYTHYHKDQSAASLKQGSDKLTIDIEKDSNNKVVIRSSTNYIINDMEKDLALGWFSMNVTRTSNFIPGEESGRLGLTERGVINKISISYTSKPATKNKSRLLTSFGSFFGSGAKTGQGKSSSPPK